MDEVIAEFLGKNRQFSRVEWDGGLTVYFWDGKEPFGLTEFVPGSDTRLLLEELHERLAFLV